MSWRGGDDAGIETVDDRNACLPEPPCDWRIVTATLRASQSAAKALLMS
jgi:hypothetical protein